MSDFVFPIKGAKFQQTEFIEALSDDFLIEDGVYVSQQEVQFAIQDFGIFSIKENNQVLFKSFHENFDQNVLNLYLSGPVSGVLLFQNKMLALHGSSISYLGKAIVFCGNSGAGKSTTAYSFCKIGAKLLNDDLTVLSFENDDVFVNGLTDKIKLWKESFDLLKIDYSINNKIWSEDSRNKFYYELKSENDKKSVNLIFILEIGEEFNITQLNKNEALVFLSNQIYKKEFLKKMKETEVALFHKIIKLLAFVQVFKVTRTKDTHPDFLAVKLNDFIKKL